VQQLALGTNAINRGRKEEAVGRWLPRFWIWYFAMNV